MRLNSMSFLFFTCLILLQLSTIRTCSPKSEINNCRGLSTSIACLFGSKYQVEEENNNCKGKKDGDQCKKSCSLFEQLLFDPFQCMEARCCQSDCLSGTEYKKLCIKVPQGEFQKYTSITERPQCKNDVHTSKPIEARHFDTVGIPKRFKIAHRDGYNWMIWPRGVIPYWLDPDFSQADRENISKAITYIEKETCLRFEPATDNKRPRMDIIAVHGHEKCYGKWFSNRGTQTCSEIELTPSSSCTVTRTIVHELLHGIGFFHTHQRKDRDQYVEIDNKTISPGQEKEFKILDDLSHKTHGMEYDCDSVMHYASDQKCLDGTDCIKPKSDSCKLLKFAEWQRHEPMMSSNDVKAIQMQYGQFCSP